MRSLGLGLIMVGASATVAAMFLPAYDIPIVGEDGSQNYWEAFSGLDIALVVSCAVSGLLALFTLISPNRVTRQLALLAAALMFGLAVAVIPDSIHENEEYVRAGIWVVGGTGAVALVGAVVASLTETY